MLRWMHAAAALAVAAPAYAGTMITSETTAPQKEAAGRSVAYIEGDRVRIEAPGAVTIFRGDQNVMYTLLPAQKKYMRMTPETLKEMAAALEKERAAMAEQLKSMPPARRAEAQKMLAMMTPSDMPKIEFRKAGGSGSVGNWPCERVEQLASGRPEAQLCVVKSSELGIGPDDLAPLEQLSAFMMQAAPQGAAAAAAMDPKGLETTVGYPAYAVLIEIPAAKIKTVTKAVEKRPIDAALFEVPPGYKEEKMPPPN